MIKYHLPVCIPVFLDRLIAGSLLFMRWVWYGYTFRRIKLANSDKYAIVDQADYAELSKYVWLADYSYGSYRIIRFVLKGKGRTTVLMHRQIMADELKKKMQRSKEKLYIDHKNRDSRDNRRANLRVATYIQNASNRVKDNKKYSSVYKGVCWNKLRKKWFAVIKSNHRRMFLGYFDDEIEAAKCYDEAAQKYHREFACLNFPPPDKRGLKNFIKYWFSHREHRGHRDNLKH